MMKSLNRSILLNINPFLDASYIHPRHYYIKKKYIEFEIENIFQYSYVNYTESYRFVSKYEYKSNSALKIYNYEYKIKMPYLDLNYWEHEIMNVESRFEAETTQYFEQYEGLGYFPDILNKRLKEKFKKIFFKRYQYKKYMQIFRLHKSRDDEIFPSCVCHNISLDKINLNRYELELKKKLNNKNIYNNYYLPWFYIIKSINKKNELSSKTTILNNLLDNLIRLKKIDNKYILDLFIKKIHKLNQVENLLKIYKSKLRPEFYNIFKTIRESQYDWQEDFERFFVDTRGKSRIIHGSHGFLGYIAEDYEVFLPDNHIDEDDEYTEEYLEFCYLVSNISSKKQITKTWPRSKLITKKQENYFQHLEIRDQIFRYYYLDDGYSRNYLIIDSIDDLAEEPIPSWRWTYCKHQLETSEKDEEDDILFIPGFSELNGYDQFKNYCSRYNFFKDLHKLSSLFILLVAIICLHVLLRELYIMSINAGYYHEQDQANHFFTTYVYFEKPIDPYHALNPTNAYIWGLEDYPLYLNITSQTHIQSYSIILHSDTYKRALSKYSGYNQKYFYQDSMSYGFKKINYEYMNEIRAKPKSIKNKKNWLIFGHKFRYKWDGYVARRKLLGSPYFYDFLNDRRGSYRDLRGVTNVWKPHLYTRSGAIIDKKNIEEGKITSLTHKYYFDFPGKLYRFFAYYTPHSVSDIFSYLSHTPYREEFCNVIQFDVLYKMFSKSFIRYALAGEDAYALYWPDPWLYKHPYSPTRNYRHNFLSQWTAPWEYYYPQVLIREWLARDEYRGLQQYKNYMTTFYYPTQQTQEISKAQNYFKKLMKFGYDISNTGVNNNGFAIPSFLNFIIKRQHRDDLTSSNTHVTVSNAFQKLKANLSIYQSYYNAFRMIEKKSHWKDYLEIKPFFDYMVNYDRNKLNLINHNLSYYKMPHIDEDKVYLLEQYTRPKTRKKIKKKTFKLLNGIKYIERMYPTFEIYEKFKHVSIFDPFADCIIYKAVKYSPEPFPLATKMMTYLETDGLYKMPILEDDCLPLTGFPRLEYYDEIGEKITPEQTWIRTNPHDIADIFLFKQQEYMKFRTRLFIDQNRSKICIRKLLKLSEEDSYNF